VAISIVVTAGFNPADRWSLKKVSANIVPIFYSAAANLSDRDRLHLTAAVNLTDAAVIASGNSRSNSIWSKRLRKIRPLASYQFGFRQMSH
jgi:hypothetical protein